MKSAKKQNVKVKSLEDRLYWKLAGVGMIAFALFSAVALATFNWECVSSLTENVKPQTNLIGAIGNWFAYYGYVAFGIAFWFFPFALFIGGLKMLESIPKDVEEIPNRKVWLRITGLVLMMLAVTGLVQLSSKCALVQDSLTAMHLPSDAGGYVGRIFMTEFLEKGVAPFGSAFLSLGLLIVAVCMALGLSTVRKLFDWHIGEWLLSWFEETADAVEKGKEISKKQATTEAEKKKKDASFETSFRLVQLAKLVELQGHSALAMSSRVLVQNTLGNSLIDFLHGNLVSAIGLGAIAFCGSNLELLDGGLQVAFGLLRVHLGILSSELQRKFLVCLGQLCKIRIS